MRATAAERTQSATNLYLICAAAWLIPGAGHIWLGRRQKGLTFLITLTAMAREVNTSLLLFNTRNAE